jgi:acetyl esterase/lipase
MKEQLRLLRIAGVVAVFLFPAVAAAQFLPTPRYQLTDAEHATLALEVERLRREIEPTPESQKPDLAIYAEAIDRNIRQGLFFTQAGIKQALTCLAEARARLARSSPLYPPFWQSQNGFLNLGYRSEIDGSYQPYQVYIPPDLDRTKPARLDIFLHGRGGTMNELSFLTSTTWANSAFGSQTPPHLTLYPYGRANNGWRFAGERDMFEALADLQKRFKVDPDQITLRGFSMGGHGCWHIGLQHPDQWAVMAPGAGFTDTLEYQKITEQLPEWQLKLLHLYDPVDYARNARDLPLLAYCGEDDPARSQHELIMGRLKTEGAPVREYIGPKTGHAYEPAVRTEILAQMENPKRPAGSPDVDFVTYTLRWPECRWARIEGLQRHWDRTEVQAQREGDELRVTTKNVSLLNLKPQEGRSVERWILDGQRLSASDRARHLFQREGSGRWRRIDKLPDDLRKKPGLQGPIDDAQFGPLVAVRPSGRPWSPAMDRWLKAELQRFRDGWDEYYRAKLPEVEDTELTAGASRGKNLYLFGDPGSNHVLARLLPKLPIRWTRDRFTFAGQGYDPEDRVPVFVFPNPEDPEHYVVVNCGFTFSRVDWQGSNALQYPHLPDWAVLKFDPEHYSDDHRANALAAGFFDERWKIAAN